MKITGRGWNALTLGEKLATISNAINKNKERWDKLCGSTK